jgi:hypothetical protein
MSAFPSTSVHQTHPRSSQLRDVWAGDLDGRGVAEVEALEWLSRCTLDVIGLTGFGYAFDALANGGTKPNELQRAFAVVFGEEDENPLMQLLEAVVPLVRYLVTLTYSPTYSCAHDPA